MEMELKVREFLTKADGEMMDTLWMLCYSLPSMSAYDRHSELFRNLFVRAANRNHKLISGRTPVEVQKITADLAQFIFSSPDFLAVEHYNEDRGMLLSMMSQNYSERKISKILEFPNISDLQRDLLTFISMYISKRVNDSITLAQDKPELSESGYAFFEDFFPEIDYESNTVEYYILNDLKLWTGMFNLLFDRDLGQNSIRSKRMIRTKGINLEDQITEDITYYDIGDELVKLGIGYWVFSLSSLGNYDLRFAIHSFGWDRMNSEFRSHDLETRIETILAETEKVNYVQSWIDDSDETPTHSDNISEKEIEDYLVENLTLIGEGLELVQRQYPTAVGSIDILCKTIAGDLVIVEIKKGQGAAQDVGQLLKYLVWVDEYVCKDSKVTGVIVAKSSSEGMESAIQGSKYEINVQLFHNVPPTTKNVRHCERCSRINRMTTKYCVKCGQDFWM